MYFANTLLHAGSLPLELSELGNLEVILMEKNQFTGKLSNLFKNASKPYQLQTIDFSGTFVNDFKTVLFFCYF